MTDTNDLVREMEKAKIEYESVGAGKKRRPVMVRKRDESPRVTKDEYDSDVETELEESTDEWGEWDDINKERLKELVKMSERGQIKKTAKSLEKLTEDQVELLYKQVHNKRMTELNNNLTEEAISLYTKALDFFGIVETADIPNLEGDLKGNKTFKDELYRYTEMLTDYLPFAGLISGGVTTAKYVKLNKDITPVDGVPGGNISPNESE